MQIDIFLHACTNGEIIHFKLKIFMGVRSEIKAVCFSPDIARLETNHIFRVNWWLIFSWDGCILRSSYIPGNLRDNTYESPFGNSTRSYVKCPHILPHDPYSSNSRAVPWRWWGRKVFSQNLYNQKNRSRFPGEIYYKTL